MDALIVEYQVKNFLIPVAIALSGCAALPPAISDAQRDASFRKGEFRLECRGAVCGGRWGVNRETAKRLYNNGQWSELAGLVTRVGKYGDLSYFFLGSAAMGLGYSDAAKVYFKKAIEHPNKCSGVLDVCSGFDVPKLSQQALNRLLSSIPVEIPTRQPDSANAAVPMIKTPRAASIEFASKKCAELGVKPGTEKFGECVLRLTK